jgi:hypothetical protein
MSELQITTNWDNCPPTKDVRDALVGRRIVSVARREATAKEYDLFGDVGILTLDDGTVVEVAGHDGGCACSAGCYELSHLGQVDNVITDVRIEDDPASEDDRCSSCDSWDCLTGCIDPKKPSGTYRLFVLSETWQMLAEFEGTDGNGYYGSGWHFRVLGTRDTT